MVHLELAVELDYVIQSPGADFIFNVQAAHTRCQTVVSEQLQISQPLLPQSWTDPATANRYLRLQAQPGLLQLAYRCTLELHHHIASPAQMHEVPVSQLPSSVLSYIYPSRYCQSDRLAALAMAEFGQLPQGYARVKAIEQWVQRNVRFQSNTSNSNTSALDTLIDRVGVCRDFAHLMIALCRALSIPARFAAGTDYGADPQLGPTDFHAYVEVYLGQRWVIFDPSGTAIPMGFMRLGTGRDAADVSFATIFGSVQTSPPRIEVIAKTDTAGRWSPPVRIDQALSTDAGA
jgi:transglutaminase-like putative cysteine protease